MIKSDNNLKFNKKNMLQRLFMPISESEDYYRLLRKYEFDCGKKLKCIRLRETLYPLFVKFVAVDRIIRKQTITVLGNKKRYKEQIIYACTHIGGDDCQRVFEAIRRGCWWFIGDPGYLYKDAAGLLLHLNGCIMLDTGDKEDRHIAYLRGVELLNNGGSLMIYPEGARNGTENLPVMEMFQGTAKMAIETNTKIIPIAIEQYKKRFVINIGNEIFPNNFCSNTDLTQKLRDILATLKWEIREREELLPRSSLEYNYRELFIKKFEERIFPYDTLESVERTRYHSGTTSPKEAFAHLDKLIPSKENAFLFKYTKERF